LLLKSGPAIKSAKTLSFSDKTQTCKRAMQLIHSNYK